MTSLPEMGLTQEEKKEVIQIISYLIGKLIGYLLFNAILAGLLYAILHYLIGVTIINYFQVFGVILIFKFIKFLLKK